MATKVKKDEREKAPVFAARRIAEGVLPRRVAVELGELYGQKRKTARDYDEYGEAFDAIRRADCRAVSTTKDGYDGGTACLCAFHKAQRSKAKGAPAPAEPDLGALADALEAATARGPCERIAAGTATAGRCFDLAHDKERASRGKVRGMRDWKPEEWGFCDGCTAHYHASMARVNVGFLLRNRALGHGVAVEPPPGSLIVNP